MSKKHGPDFVCIGAQKGGTTWLYENLVAHDDVWMSPVKEFHYFNRVCINDELLGNWNTPHPHGIKRYSEVIKSMNLKKLRWLKEYYELGMTSDWYIKLFDEKYTGGKVSGDITPAYSTLEARGVRYASEILGADLPVIFILRNPVYRSWSAAKMLLRYQQRAVDKVSSEDINRLLNNPVVSLYSQYYKAIMLWRKYFRNVHVLSFDELCKSPETLLSKISHIVGIHDDWDDEIVRKRVWADEKNLPIPDEVARLLVAQYADEISRLQELDGCEFANDWHDEIRMLANKVA